MRSTEFFHLVCVEMAKATQAEDLDERVRLWASLLGDLGRMLESCDREAIPDACQEIIRQISAVIVERICDSCRPSGLNGYRGETIPVEPMLEELQYIMGTVVTNRLDIAIGARDLDRLHESLDDVACLSLPIKLSSDLPAWAIKEIKARLEDG